MEFSRQEYWSGLPLPPRGNLPDPGMEHVSLAALALVAGFFTTSATWDPKLTSRENTDQWLLGREAEQEEENEKV